MKSRPSVKERRSMPGETTTLLAAFRLRGKLLRAAVHDLEDTRQDAEQFRNQLDVALQEIDRLRAHRLALAKLAAPTSQFSNPIVAWEAQALRDRILAGGD
jgi:uncharacterized protein (DUF3084 family)